MLGSQKVVSINHRTTAASNLEAETCRIDIVSPHDSDAVEQLVESWDMGNRLPSLMRSAARSRDLAEVHKCVAREGIKAARSAQSLGENQLYLQHVEAVKQARRKVWDCSRFSSQCEERVQALMASGTGRP